MGIAYEQYVRMKDEKRRGEKRRAESEAYDKEVVQKWNEDLAYAKANPKQFAKFESAVMQGIESKLVELMEDSEFMDKPLQYKQNTVNQIFRSLGRTVNLHPYVDENGYIYYNQSASIIGDLPKAGRVFISGLFTFTDEVLFGAPERLSNLGISTTVAKFSGGVGSGGYGSKPMIPKDDTNVTGLWMQALRDYKRSTAPAFYSPIMAADIVGTVIGMIPKFNVLAKGAQMVVGVGRPIAQTMLTLGILPWTKFENAEGLAFRKSYPEKFLKAKMLESGKNSLLGGLTGFMGSKISNKFIRTIVPPGIFGGATFVESKVEGASTADALNAAAMSVSTLLAHQFSGSLVKPKHVSVKKQIAMVENNLYTHLRKTGKMPRSIARKAAHLLTEAQKPLMAEQFIGQMKALETKFTSGKATRKEIQMLKGLRETIPKAFPDLKTSTWKPFREYTTENYLEEGIKAKQQALQNDANLTSEYYLQVARSLRPDLAAKEGRLTRQKTISKYYHGSPKKGLTKIKPSQGDYGYGVYFGNKKIAKAYAPGRKNVSKYVLGDTNKKPSKGYIYPVDPKLKNPLIISSEKQYSQLLETHGDTNKGIGKFAKNQNYDGIINKVTGEHIKFTSSSVVIPVNNSSQTILQVLADNIKTDMTKSFDDQARKIQALSTKATDEVQQSLGFINPQQPKVSSGLRKIKGRSKIRAFLKEKSEKPESLLFQMGDNNMNTAFYNILYKDIDAGITIENGMYLRFKGLSQNNAKTSGLTVKDLQKMSPALQQGKLGSAISKVIGKGSGRTNTQPFTLKDGTKIELTTANVLDMYIGLHNSEWVAAHTIKEGWDINNKQVFKPNGMKSRLTKADIVNITNTLNIKERQLIHKSMPMMNMLAELMNDTSVKMQGVREFSVKNWWHVDRTNPKPKMRGPKASTPFSVLENRSMFREKVKHTNARASVGDFFINQHNAIVDASAYVGLAGPLRNAKAMMTDKAFSEAVKAKYSPQTYKVLQDYLVRVEDTSMLKDAHGIGSAVSYLTGKGVQSYLGLNLKVSTKQPISYLLSAEETGMKRMLKGITYIPTKQDVKDVMEHNPQLAMRLVHHRIMRETGNLGQSGIVKKFYTNKISSSDVMMALIAEGDWMGSIGKIQNNVKAEMAETHPHLKGPSGAFKGSPEYWNHWMNRTNLIVIRTQPTWHPKDRSSITGTRNPLLRPLTLFHSQKEATIGMINRTVTQFALDGKALPALKHFSLIGMTAAMYGLVDMGFRYARTGKKPTVNEFMGELTKNTVGLPPIVGDIVGTAAKNAFAVLDYSNFRQDPLDTVPEAGPRTIDKANTYLLKAAAYYLTKEREDKQPKELKWKIEAWKAGEEIAKAVGLITGVPQTIIKGGFTLVDVVNDFD